jgi:threonine/homoserine/homoserine lactone efflux protein
MSEEAAARGESPVRELAASAVREVSGSALREQAGTGGTAGGHAVPGWRRRFAEGFIVAVSNPKALIFFAAFLPQFMTPGTALWLQFLILGGTFGLVELAYELVVAGAAQRIAPWLGRNGRWFNRIAGATFVGIGGLLALARR